MRAVFGAMVVAAVVWLALPAGADAPRTLGEAAAKEKDKKKPAKVYTEDDLHNRKGGTGSYSQPAADGTTTDASATGQKKADGDKTAKPGEKAADKPKTEDEQRAEAEKGWQDRMAQAQKDVATWSAEVDRLQAALGDNRPSYAPGRAQALEALENAKKQLAAAQQTVADLQEEGRRNRYR